MHTGVASYCASYSGSLCVAIVVYILSSGNFCNGAHIFYATYLLNIVFYIAVGVAMVTLYAGTGFPGSVPVILTLPPAEAGGVQSECEGAARGVGVCVQPVSGPSDNHYQSTLRLGSGWSGWAGQWRAWGPAAPD